MGSKNTTYYLSSLFVTVQHPLNPSGPDPTVGLLLCWSKEVTKKGPRLAAGTSAAVARRVVSPVLQADIRRVSGRPQGWQRWFTQGLPGCCKHRCCRFRTLSRWDLHRSGHEVPRPRQGPRLAGRKVSLLRSTALVNRTEVRRRRNARDQSARRQVKPIFGYLLAACKK